MDNQIKPLKDLEQLVKTLKKKVSSFEKEENSLKNTRLTKNKERNEFTKFGVTKAVGGSNNFVGKATKQCENRIKKDAKVKKILFIKELPGTFKDSKSCEIEFIGRP